MSLWEEAFAGKGTARLPAPKQVRAGRGPKQQRALWLEPREGLGGEKGQDWGRMGLDHSLVLKATANLPPSLSKMHNCGPVLAREGE